MARNHGRVSCYNNDQCRCRACRRAMADYQEEYRAPKKPVTKKDQRARAAGRFAPRRIPQSRINHGHPPGTMPVTCWCEDAIVLVPEADIIAGRTHSCGLDACTPLLVPCP